MMEQGEQADESADSAELSSNIADTGLNSILLFFSHYMMPFEYIYFTNIYNSSRIVSSSIAMLPIAVFLVLIHKSSFQNLTPNLTPDVPILNARLVIFTVVPLGTVNINIIKINFFDFLDLSTLFLDLSTYIYCISIKKKGLINNIKMYVDIYSLPIENLHFLIIHLQRIVFDFDTLMN